MTKTAAFIFTLLLTSLSIKVFAQTSGAFIWCYEPGHCRVNIGYNHARPLHNVRSNTISYSLVYSSFSFDDGIPYIDPDKSGQQVTTLYFSGFADLYWNDTIELGTGDLKSSGLCIGGKMCGLNNSIYFPAPYDSGKTITKIEVTGHDRIGNKHKAGIALYEGDKRLGLISVKKKGGTYTFNIDHNITQPLRLTSIRKDGDTWSGDETFIEKIKIYVNDR